MVCADCCKLPRRDLFDLRETDEVAHISDSVLAAKRSELLGSFNNLKDRQFGRMNNTNRNQKTRACVYSCTSY